jgi:plastocyanin
LKPVSGFAARLWARVDASSATDAWAVGSGGQTGGSTIAHWDGTGWSRVDAPRQPYIDIEAASANDVWAISNSNNRPTTFVEHFDGTSWTQVSAPYSNLFAIDSTSPSDVWAVGGSHDASLAPFAAHWDGKSWSGYRVGSLAQLGAVEASLTAVSTLSPSDVWAVGRFAVAEAAHPDRTFAAHWDGSAWTLVPTANPDPVSDQLTAVSALAPNDVWAVGLTGSRGLTSPNGGAHLLVEHWDGVSWSVVRAPDPGPGSALYGIAAFSANDVWAVGSGSTASTLIEHWDGTSWSVVQPSLSPVILFGVAALPDGTLFAAGGALYQLCEISVRDDATFPASASGILPGTTVAWGFASTNSASHSVTDASGMGLFDSGLRAPGGSFTNTFNAAGSYPIIDQATGHKSALKVSMTVAPGAGTTTTAFTLTFAATSAPAGYAYDLQVKRPGVTAYADLAVGTAAPNASFTPDAGPGSYSFRVRIRNTGNGASSGWSSAKTITVS